MNIIIITILCLINTFTFLINIRTILLLKEIEICNKDLLRRIG